MFKPLYQELSFQRPEHYAQRLPHKGMVWLDSASFDKHARYSYIAFLPPSVFRLRGGKLNGRRIEGCPMSALKQSLEQHKTAKIEGLPPFQGGVAGFLSYDLAGYFEDLPNQTIDPLQTPDYVLGVYDLVLAFDIQKAKAWLISTGLNLQGEPRQAMAQRRLDLAKKWLEQGEQTSQDYQIGPIESSHDQDAYTKMVQTTIDYIFAGDIFEANVAQQWYAPFTGSAFGFYQKLRQTNPAPFAAFCDFDDFKVLSSSPERFIKVTGPQVETQPIKGTMARSKDLKQDQALAEQLLMSEKDKSENIMIVDLMRNDLSKVCQPHSIQVPELCALESYAKVHHLVSTVKGQLKPQYQAIDLIPAAFPGGSITGAPKIRAMEIIEELEVFKRGLYCGSIGYLAFNGDMDTNIAIRTIAIANQRLQFGAGGAVTADSDPLSEYQESCVKASALINACQL